MTGGKHLDGMCQLIMTIERERFFGKFASHARNLHPPAFAVNAPPLGSRGIPFDLPSSAVPAMPATKRRRLAQWIAKGRRPTTSTCVVVFPVRLPIANMNAPCRGSGLDGRPQRTLVRLDPSLITNKEISMFF